MTHNRNTEPVKPVWNATDPMGSFRLCGEYLHQKAKQVFLKDQTHAEMMFIFKSNGECFVKLVRGDRDEFVASLRKLITDSSIIGIVHIAEAWTRFGGQGDHITTQLIHGEMAVSDLKPEERGEALFVGMQSRDGQTLTWVEPIIRDGSGKVTLGKGFTIDEIGGRYAGLFR
jgi:hypothetical protein